MVPLCSVAAVTAPAGTIQVIFFVTVLALGSGPGVDAGAVAGLTNDVDCAGVIVTVVLDGAENRRNGRWVRFCNVRRNKNNEEEEEKETFRRHLRVCFFGLDLFLFCFLFPLFCA